MRVFGPNWRRQARIASGLILFTFVLFHLLNAALGLYDLGLMERAQDWRLRVTQSVIGTALIYGALLIHAALAVEKLLRKRSWRMPGWELAQILLGLAIPGLLIGHLASTRMAQELFGVNVYYRYELAMLWPDYAGFQTALVLVVWLHGCVGLHFWLRFRPAYRRLAPWLLSVAVLVPAAALAGFLVAGRAVARIEAHPPSFARLKQMTNFPDDAARAVIDAVAFNGGIGLHLSALALLGFLVWRVRWRKGRGAVRVTYVYGPALRAAPGPTLLEISRLNGVPHASLCGGKGRCTTCRVRVTEGMEKLPPPDEAEAKALANAGAGPEERLACQIRPVADISVQRVFEAAPGGLRPDHRRGEEGRRAVLFLDLRDFTRLSAGRLPYDVVFLLNRFFDAVTPEVERNGGHIDKYLGDGFLAIFADRPGVGACRAALDAAAAIDRALERFNDMLAEEGHEPLRIGIGVHVGELVLGAIGSGVSAAPTIIGEAVNAASRLEALTKELGAQLVVSEAVAREAGLTGFTVFEREVRGIRGAMRLVKFARAREVELERV